MNKYTRFFLITLLFSALALTSCGSVLKAAPASTMEAYWNAMADKDSAALSNLSCPDYEAQALSTLDSFLTVELTPKDIKCTTLTLDGNNAEVTCKGSLNATYGTEAFSFDLSTYTYSVVNLSGDWQMCGEK
jgi:hypothetical protein